MKRMLITFQGGSLFPTLREVDVYLLCYKGSSYVHEADPNILLYFIRWTSIFFISYASRDLDMFPEAVAQYYVSQAGLYLLRS